MKSYDERILDGLRGQNEQAELNGRRGFWCQSDCVFIEAESPQRAIEIYREKVSRAQIGIVHNHLCNGICELKYSFPSSVPVQDAGGGPSLAAEISVEAGSNLPSRPPTPSDGPSDAHQVAGFPLPRTEDKEATPGGTEPARVSFRDQWGHTVSGRMNHLGVEEGFCAACDRMVRGKW